MANLQPNMSEKNGSLFHQVNNPLAANLNSHAIGQAGLQNSRIAASQLQQTNSVTLNTNNH